MTILPVILLAAALVYACRVAGFAINTAQPTLFYRHFLKFVPVTVFTVLIVTALFRQPDSLMLNLIALIIATGVMRFSRNFGLSLLVGLVSVWLMAGIEPG